MRKFSHKIQRFIFKGDGNPDNYNELYERS